MTLPKLAALPIGGSSREWLSWLLHIVVAALLAFAVAGALTLHRHDAALVSLSERVAAADRQRADDVRRWERLESKVDRLLELAGPRR